MSDNNRKYEAYHMATATINKIEHYLANDMSLTEYQKECIIYALNKVRDDEYDRTEHRIMEPISMSVIDDGHTRIRRDKFELNFHRLLL